MNPALSSRKSGMNLKFTRGGVTTPLGFTACGISCGIKKSGKKDIALIYSEKPCVAAGVFTTNKVQASSVSLDKKHLKAGHAQAIIVNSGNANCLTGARGAADSERMAGEAARALGIAKKQVCVASTGVIGKPLPMEKIIGAIPELVSGLAIKGGRDTAHAILTTDHVAKEVAAKVSLGGRTVRIGAVAKGCGMIHPEMALPHATMLCFVTTDAAIASAALRAALDKAVQGTFNMITVDGDMSTNDMVLVLANGLAKNKLIAKGTKDFEVFAATLENIFRTLSHMMVRDAEGATKFVEVVVKRARSAHDARAVARTVASSNLVKCALFGSDPNWGRIAAAAGRSGAYVDPWKIKIYLGKELVLQKGGGVRKPEKVLRRIFAAKNIGMIVDLGLGTHHATAYTCDLSTAYVTLNSAYRT